MHGYSVDAIYRTLSYATHTHLKRILHYNKKINITIASTITFFTPHLTPIQQRVTQYRGCWHNFFSFYK